MAQISDELIALYRAAAQAAAQSYSPYSHFPVGAAILTAAGAVYTGTNVENRSFGLTNCAERTSAFKAVSDGKRSFAAVAIATPRSEYP
ncbi:MAG: cytidine deaminase, partial [Treponemataceae bacterium]|nr:cytidine deaminase [Treponemataceae bacterium]